MARPKIDEKEQRKKSVMVRFSDEEYSRLEYFCEQSHRNKSEYLRDLFLGDEPKIVNQTTVDLPEIQNLLREYSRIGNNINQLAKYFNEGNILNPAIEKELGQCLTELHNLNIGCNDLIKKYSGGR